MSSKATWSKAAKATVTKSGAPKSGSKTTKFIKNHI